MTDKPPKDDNKAESQDDDDVQSTTSSSGEENVASQRQGVSPRPSSASSNPGNGILIGQSDWL